MTPIRLFASVALVHMLVAAPSAAATLTTLFDGRWRNDDSTATLRWLDVRIVEGPKSGLLAWWTCAAPGGCISTGSTVNPNGMEIYVSYNNKQWKTALRLTAAQDGTLIVDEDISYADGRHMSAAHRLRRWSAVPSVEYTDNLEVNGPQTLVRTGNGGAKFVTPPNPGREAPRVSDRCDVGDFERCRAPLDIQALRPPFNPDDPGLVWVSQYNALLWQILARLVRPDQLQMWAAAESGNPYDMFVRRSELLDILTAPR